ncbi:ROK family protein [Labrys sp. KNU-23]|uniref:ROK family protein n=1 Tax=Labrys sp. KNU-23 TaxID=2789216 RepID=UPI0011ED6569|nr:ROK family protein [Labrys sp. KNU-23]QEN85271.1 ROK family protein [Labrys sp. KNU-23]
MNDQAGWQFLNHGGEMLPSVRVDGYNIGLRDQDGFVGDKANTGAFLEKLEALRLLYRKAGNDPLGEEATEEIKRKQIDDMLVGDDLNSAALVHGALEEFARSLSSVIRRFLRTASWQHTERIVIGGGFRESRVGRLAIARTQALLSGEGIPVEVIPIANHPDEAGLIGSLHLLPPYVLANHDGMLAVDIGGRNIRAGIVLSQVDKQADLGRAKVEKLLIWRHADDEPARTAAIGRLGEMLQDLRSRAEKNKISLTPVIGVGCPGAIKSDGSIARGGQNLPGSNWEGANFNLPAALLKFMPRIGGQPSHIVLHNDAVVQGLSEVPHMGDVKRWGILTIGTGLGNARFTNRRKDGGKASAR